MIFTAASLAALVGAVALSVDIGNLSFTKRNLQTIADAAAMDARFALRSPTACADALKLADQSANNNGFNPIGSGNSLLVTLGNATVVNDVETFTADASTCANGDPAQSAATAVEVQTSGNLAFTFVPGSRTPSATAYWTQGNPETGVSIGTNLVTLSTADSKLLGPLLSGIGGVNLQAVGYQGLANGNVTLGQLAAALNVGSVSQLLTTSVTYPQLLSAEASALGTQGPSAQVALNALNGLINQSAGGTFPTQFNLGQLLNVQDPGAASAADISTNVLGLVTGGAELAHGTGPNSSAINIPAVSLGIPGVTNVTASAQIIEPPQSAYGPVGTAAHTAQVNVNLTATITLPLGLASVTVPLQIVAAEGTATIAAISCGGTPPPVFDVSTNAIRVTVPSSAPGPLSASTLLLGPVATAAGSLSFGSSPTKPIVLTGSYPENIPGQNINFSDAQFGSGGLQVTLLPGLLGPLISLGSLVDPILVPALNTLTTTLVDPLLDDLGVDVGTGVVFNPGPTTCGSGFLF